MDHSSSFAPPPHSPPDSYTKHSAGSSDHANFPNHDQSLGDVDDILLADPTAGRSSSEEKDSSVPAQSKRKAQNRAAYVEDPTKVHTKTNFLVIIVNEHSASEKSAM